MIRRMLIDPARITCVRLSRAVRTTLTACCLAAVLSACGAVSVAGSAVGASITVAGAVIGTGVTVAGKVATTAIDLAVPDGDDD